MEQAHDEQSTNKLRGRAEQLRRIEFLPQEINTLWSEYEKEDARKSEVEEAQKQHARSNHTSE